MKFSPPLGFNSLVVKSPDPVDYRHLPAAQRGPYTYVVYLLQRTALHPARDVIERTLRVCKECFAANPPER